jgi:hypothetical protein
MAAPIRWIEGLERGRLTIAPCPAFLGTMLEEQVRHWRASGVDVVASLLCPPEIAELSLVKEPELCAAQGIEFLSFPIPDHSVPLSTRDTLAFALRLSGLLGKGKSVLIHCRAGIGRSVVIAACVMALQGVPPRRAFPLIGAARGFLDVPDTEEQREWVMEFVRCLPPGVVPRRIDDELD